MKKGNRFMALVALILVFALTFTGVSIPAKAATTTTISSITVKNLPSNTLTLKAGKTFTLRTNTTSGNLKFSTSNKKIVTVSSAGKIKAVKKGSANITISQVKCEDQEGGEGHSRTAYHKSQGEQIC
ncbi:MAG: Ig domain-containing protein [Coprococcus sp.]